MTAPQTDSMSRGAGALAPKSIGMEIKGDIAINIGAAMLVQGNTFW